MISYNATENKHKLLFGIQAQKTHLESKFHVFKQRPVETSQTLIILSVLADKSHCPL